MLDANIDNCRSPFSPADYHLVKWHSRVGGDAIPYTAWADANDMAWINPCFQLLTVEHHETLANVFWRPTYEFVGIRARHASKMAECVRFSMMDGSQVQIVIPAKFLGCSAAEKGGHPAEVVLCCFSGLMYWAHREAARFGGINGPVEAFHTT